MSLVNTRFVQINWSLKFFYWILVYLSVSVCKLGAEWLLVRVSCRRLWPAGVFVHSGRPVDTSQPACVFSDPVFWFFLGVPSAHQLQLSCGVKRKMLITTATLKTMQPVRSVIPLLLILVFAWDPCWLVVGWSVLIDAWNGKSSLLGSGIILSGGW